MITFRLKTGLMAAACALALTAAGCREDDGARRIAVPDPTPIGLMPDPMALPYAEPAPVNWTGGDVGYRWAERAYGLEQAFYDAPPDYAFDYGGVQPWVWETADDWSMYAEPWDDGYRYYYYEPGAAYPYFVRDGDYGYGYDPAGMLVALFDADGDYLPAERFYEAAPLAGRYYLHGRDLRNAAVQAQRIPVTQDVWVQRAPRVREASEPWLRAAKSDQQWRTWRDRRGDRELERFAREARRRDRQTISAHQVASLEPQRIPADRRWEAPRDVPVRRDLARAEREALRAQREQAREMRQANAGRVQAEQRRAERQMAQRAEGQRAQAERRAQREQARAAESHARHAAAQARAQEDRGPRPERGGGGWKPERGGGPQHQAKPQHQDHGGSKPDRGGGGGQGGGKGGEGKGGGKKD
ncbi:hypothetical protein [Phenylobacterium sp.]|uniref:hypothetical protein n=1 Tax=Phenylobacterium sp. TaxID=1871053 RepID=UPI0028115308|nr:hypothetical protein [Phenylobacterium sp.]